MKKLNKFFVCILLIFLTSFCFSLDIEKDIIQKAILQKGARYKLGGINPPNFDCSGFINFLIKPFEPNIPRTSLAISNKYPSVSRKNLMPGDLVFFATTLNKNKVSHVALYIGDNKIIHSISGGPETGVVISSLDRAYWNRTYYSAARVFDLKNQSTKPVVNTKTTKQESEKKADVVKPSEVRVSEKDSVWDSFTGYLEGDYALWKSEEEKAFAESKSSFEDYKKSESFDEWKNR